MSVALSNRFQGRRRCPHAVPRPCPHPVSPARHLCARGGRWGLPRAGSGRGPRARGPGETPASPAASLSPPGGKAFGLLKARQERRLAEINRVSARRRLLFSSPAASEGSLRVGPKAPSAPRVPPPSARLCLPQNQAPFLSFTRASPDFFPPAPSLCLQVGPPPPRPPPSGLGLQVVTHRLGR